MKIWICMVWVGLLPAQNQHLENGKLEPERDYDLVHVDYQITLFPENESFKGIVTHTILPFSDTKNVKFDAVGLEITKVWINQVPALFQPFERSPRQGIEVLSTNILHAFQEAKVTIEYQGQKPEKGLYFVDASFSDGLQIWTQGEDMDNRFWLPIYDYPNDRTTCEGRISVPKNMQVIGNGSLLSTKPDENHPDHLIFHWKLEQTQVPYLIAFAAGEWEEISTTFSGQVGPINIRTFSGKGTPQDVLRIAHQELIEMMALFEEKFGSYPWPKYDQVFVSNFPYGGMENTTITINNDEELLNSSQKLTRMRGLRGLVSHELAHHWFGNLVTTRDWANLWLNEGFATYAEWMYEKRKVGKEAYQWLSADNADYVIHEPENDPMVEHAFWPGNDGEYHGEYMQGAAVIAWIHHLLGDDLFLRLIRNYLNKHQFDIVQTAELQEIIKDTTGKNLDWLFEQFVFKPGYPNLTINAEFNQENGDLTLQVTQTQEDVYRFPLEMAFQGTSLVTKTFWLHQKSHEFRIPFPQEPQWIDMNPSGVGLYTYTFEQEQSVWRNMASGHPHPFKRIKAFEKLAPPKPVDWIQRLTNEPSPEVKEKILFFLTQLEELEPELIEITQIGLTDSDARVRSTAAVAARNFDPNKKIKKQLSKLIRKDSSSEVRKNALLTMAKWEPDPHQINVKEAMHNPEYEWFDFFPDALLIYGQESIPWGFDKIGQREVYYLTHFLTYLEEEDSEHSLEILEAILQASGPNSEIPKFLVRFMEGDWNDSKSRVFQSWLDRNPKHAQAEVIKDYLKTKEAEPDAFQPEPTQN